MQAKKKQGWRRAVYHVLMLLFSFLMLYPLLWMISSSLKPGDQIMITQTQLIPAQITFENYVTGWAGFARNSFATFFKNSLLVAVVRVAGTVISACLTAFAMARMNFKGRKFWFAIMIGTMCLPGMILRVPQYLLFNTLGWVGSYKPLLIPSWFGGGAFNVFLLMQFMKNIPRDMDEAATIDGCGWNRSSAATAGSPSQSAHSTKARATASRPPCRRVRGAQPTYTSVRRPSRNARLANRRSRCGDSNSCPIRCPSARR